MDNPAYVIDLERDKQGFQKTSKQVYPTYTFEEAITFTQVGKFHYLLLLICGLCFMSVMVEIMGISIILPSMKCDLPSTLSEQGILASAGFMGVVLSSHIMGFLADTWGRVRTLRLALILSFIATIVSAFSINIWMLIVFRFLNGFLISGCQACVFSLCGEFHGNSSRVRHVTLLSGFMTLALIYLPCAAIVILPLRIESVVLGMKFSSWRILLMVNSMLSLFALAGILTLPETPKYVLVQGKPKEALDILRYIYTKNTGNSADLYPVQSLEPQTAGASLNDIHGISDALKMIWHQTTPLFYRERILHTANICVVMFAIYFISQGTFMWFPTILNELVAKSEQDSEVCAVIDNMQPADAALGADCAGNVDLFMFQVMIMMGAAYSIIYLIFAYTIDYIGKKNLLIGWLILCIVCCALLHWTTHLAPAVIQITCIMGIANCGGIVSTISMEFFPTNINAMGMCFIMMIGRLGAVVGSNAVGQILFGNCDNIFWGYLGVICCLCVLGLCLPERKHVKKAPLTVLPE